MVSVVSTWLPMPGKLTPSSRVICAFPPPPLTSKEATHTHHIETMDDEWAEDGMGAMDGMADMGGMGDCDAMGDMGDRDDMGDMADTAANEEEEEEGEEDEDAIKEENDPDADDRRNRLRRRQEVGVRVRAPVGAPVGVPLVGVPVGVPVAVPVGVPVVAVGAAGVPVSLPPPSSSLLLPDKKRQHDVEVPPCKKQKTSYTPRQLHDQFVSAVEAGKDSSFLRKPHSRLANELARMYIANNPEEVTALSSFELEEKCKNCRWADGGYTLQASLLDREITVGRFLHRARRQSKRERDLPERGQGQGESK